MMLPLGFVRLKAKVFKEQHFLNYLYIDLYFTVSMLMFRFFFLDPFSLSDDEGMKFSTVQKLCLFIVLHR